MLLHFELQVFIEIPFVLFQTLYYSIIVYAMVSFEWKAEKFFWFVFVSFFSFLYFTYYGMMTVSITPNHQVASIFAAAFYGLFNLFSGFFIPRPVSTNLVCLFYVSNPMMFFTDIILNQFFAISENSRMVGMVLLDLSSGMDSVWINCISI